MALMTWPLTSDGAGAVVYTANDWRTIITALFTEGILGASSFEVTERAAGANMQLDIAAGVAVIEGDDAAGQGRYLVRDDAGDLEAVTISTADATNPRIDRVGIQLRDPSEGGAAGRNSVFAVVAGTPAATPSAPAVPDSFLTLALVAVAAGATSITNANITDIRVHATLAHEVVDAAAVAPSAIGTSELAADSVTADELAAASSGSLGSVRYAKLGDMVSVWTISGGESVNRTLPSGFRPASAIQTTASSGGEPGPLIVSIATNGVISIPATGTLFSITFQAA